MQPPDFFPSGLLKRDALRLTLLTGLFSSEGKWVHQPPNFSFSGVLKRGCIDLELEIQYRGKMDASTYNLWDVFMWSPLKTLVLKSVFRYT